MKRCCNNIVNELNVCVLNMICGFKNCWLTSLILPCFLFPLQIFLFCTYRVLYILYMMSSLGGEKARGPREKALPAVTHTSQPQKQIQVSHRNHMNMKMRNESTVLSNTRVHTTTLANKTIVHTLCKGTSLVNIEKDFFFLLWPRITFTFNSDSRRLINHFFVISDSR